MYFQIVSDAKYHNQCSLKIHVRHITLLAWELMGGFRGGGIFDYMSPLMHQCKVLVISAVERQGTTNGLRPTRFPPQPNN